MSENVEVPASAPDDDNKFFFRAIADENGLTELTFRKQPQPLFATLFFTLDYINQTFDTPFPTLGAFLRDMAEKADLFEEMSNANSDTPTKEVPPN